VAQKREEEKLSHATMSEEERHDPLECLGPYLTLRILHNPVLTPSHLLKLALVSKAYHTVATEASLWRPRCEHAWGGKVYVPAAARGDLTWKQRYLMADADRKRTVISAEELCAFTWRFRFKRTAGAFWMQIDPYWLEGKDPAAMVQRFFHPDGTLTSPVNDYLWGEDATMRWKSVTAAEGGMAVRINQYPNLTVSRTRDWGWRMENMWVVFEAELAVEGPYAQGVGPNAAVHLA
jgi:hypothetical protein